MPFVNDWATSIGYYFYSYHIVVLLLLSFFLLLLYCRLLSLEIKTMINVDQHRFHASSIVPKTKRKQLKLKLHCNFLSFMQNNPAGNESVKVYFSPEAVYKMIYEFAAKILVFFLYFLFLISNPLVKFLLRSHSVRSIRSQLILSSISIFRMISHFWHKRKGKWWKKKKGENFSSACYSHQKNTFYNCKLQMWMIYHFSAVHFHIRKKKVKK